MSKPPPVFAENVRYERRAMTPQQGVCASAFVYTNAGPLATSFEWNLVAILDNEAATGDNCASYFQANKYGLGQTWAGCFENCDMSFGQRYGNQVACEFDVWTNGPDPDHRRLGVHAVIGDARRIRTGEARNEWVEATAAFLCSHNGTDTNARWRHGAWLQHFWSSGLRIDGSDDPNNRAHRGVYFGKGHFVVGFDFADATFQVPIRLGRGQKVSLEGTDSVLVGLVGDRVEISMCGQTIFAVDINTRRTHTSDGKVYPL